MKYRVEVHLASRDVFHRDGFSEESTARRMYERQTLDTNVVEVRLWASPTEKGNWRCLDTRQADG